MTPEGKVKEQVKKILKNRGIYYCMPIGTGLGRRGVPDFIACVNGWFLGIETKAGRGRTTKLQDIEHERIRSSNGLVMVVNEDGFAALEKLLEMLVYVPVEQRPSIV